MRVGCVGVNTCDLLKHRSVRVWQQVLHYSSNNILIFFEEVHPPIGFLVEHLVREFPFSMIVFADLESELFVIRRRQSRDGET